MDEPTFLRTKNGKPYVEGVPVHISLSHANGLLFFAVALQEVGVDAESVLRSVEYAAILKKYPALSSIVADERDFLKVWTQVESGLKRFGGTLARDMKRLIVENGFPYFFGEKRTAFFTDVVEGCFVTICTEEKEEVCFFAL